MKIGLSRRAALVGLLTCLAATACAEAPGRSPLPAPRPPSTLDSAADEALLAKARLSGHVSWVLMDAKTGEVLEAHDADRPLPPASVAKAPTALFALDKLGPSHIFETRVVSTGEVQNGVLRGDLVLQGGGDPETDSAEILGLARRVAGAGIRKVSGRLLVDNSLLPSMPQIDDTQPDAAAYNPAVGALNLNFNRVIAEWRRVGKSMDMNLEARSAGMSPEARSVRVEITEGGSGGFRYIGARGYEPELWSVPRASLGRAGSRWLPVRNPGIYAGDVFRTLASGEGLQMPAPVEGNAPMLANVLARTQSRPLVGILQDMLKYSTNLTAETVGMAAAIASGGRVDDLASSAASMNSWAAGFAGFPMGDPGFRLVNHSGLSPDSRLSVRRMAEMLRAAESRGFPALEGGRAATLKSLLPERRYLDKGEPEPPVKAQVLAKTGTLNFVSALAGYIEPETTGRGLIFAFIAADLDTRQLFVDMEEDAPPGAKGWAGRARYLQRALIRNWITRHIAR